MSFGLCIVGSSVGSRRAWFCSLVASEWKFYGSFDSTDSIVIAGCGGRPREFPNCCLSRLICMCFY
jgi:hypothetical protein